MKAAAVNLAVALVALLMFPANALSQAGSLSNSPDDYFYVVFPATCVDAKTNETRLTQFRIGFAKLVWDKSGKTVDVRGVKPVVAQLNGPELKVVSDLKRPSLKDGILTLTISGQPDVAGTVDIPFVIKYGRSGSIPQENLLGCSSGCCLVAH
jgi:hypothetical protein